MSEPSNPPDDADHRVVRFTNGGGRVWDFSASLLAGLSGDEVTRLVDEAIRTFPPTRIEEPVIGSSWDTVPLNIRDALRVVNDRIVAREAPPAEALNEEMAAQIEAFDAENMRSWAASQSVDRLMSEALVRFYSAHILPGESLGDETVRRWLTVAAESVGRNVTPEELAAEASRRFDEAIGRPSRQPPPPTTPAGQDAPPRDATAIYGRMESHPSLATVWDSICRNFESSSFRHWNRPQGITEPALTRLLNDWMNRQTQPQKEDSVTEINSTPADESLYYYTTDTSSWPDVKGQPTASAAYFEAIRALRLKPGHRVVVGKKARVKPENVLQTPYDSGFYAYGNFRGTGRNMPGGRNYIPKSPSAESLRELGEAINKATLEWMAKYELNPNFSTVTDQMTYSVDAYDVEIANGKLTGVGA